MMLLMVQYVPKIRWFLSELVPRRFRSQSYDFWTQTYDISSLNTENILVFLGPSEKSKFESITAFANTLIPKLRFLRLGRPTTLLLLRLSV